MLSNTSHIHEVISATSASLNPRVVTAGDPMRRPLVTKGDFGSFGTAFLFTVMFALGRLPGWIAHCKELRNDPSSRINRPRQIYTGATERDYIALDQRK